LVGLYSLRRHADTFSGSGGIGRKVLGNTEVERLGKHQVLWYVARMATSGGSFTQWLEV